MKKHSLKEHIEDVFHWDMESGLLHGLSKEGMQMLWFTAYERWLNDRPLLTEEDKT